MRIKNQTRRGDTLIEVVFAIVIFSLVAVISIALMNKGVSTSQASLEVVMARNEIDAQAEALRFIQNSFVAERELAPEQQQYVKIWQKMTRDASSGQGYAITPDQLSAFNVTSCDPLYRYSEVGSIDSEYGFILNTRMLQPSNTSIDLNDYFGDDNTESNTYGRLIDDMIIQSRYSADAFRASPVQPRLIYTHSGSASDDNSTSGALDESDGSRLYRKVAAAEGVWIVAVKGEGSDIYENGEAEYYDFHIRTCWNAVGRTTPTTIGTIVRLYNPEVIEVQS